MNIWIFNHYASNMFVDGAGRHQSLAKYLIKMGHDVTIFCANTIHGREDCVQIDDGLSRCEIGPDGVKYVFIRTIEYHNNGIDRIKNMFDYYKNIFKVIKTLKNDTNLPDAIIASSVHPLTLLAGIKIGRKYGIPCICEVRDLWPETLVELNIISRGNIITRLMYAGEKYIYEKADALIFTMPGGKKYICNQKWENKVKLDKVYHLNNGVDLDKYKSDQRMYKINDDDLNNADLYKIIYAGSIRAANKIDELVYIAKMLKEKGRTDVKMLIYGDGDQRERLSNTCTELELDNIVFKGRVDKQYVPYVLSKGNLNIVTDESNNLGQYGISWNKIFEYMASGKPVVINYDMGDYNLVSDYNFGIAKECKTAEEFCDAVVDMIDLSEEKYKNYAENAEKAADIYDYKNLACELNKILETVVAKF